MAIKTIADLADISTLADTYVFVIDDGDHNYKISWGALKALMGTVSKFENDPDSVQFPGYLKLTLANGTVLRVKPSDPDKQNKLTWDTTPALNSDNPVTSDGIKRALDKKQEAVACDRIMLSDEWEGTGPYTQEVTAVDVTAQSKIDLQPDAIVLTQLMDDGVTALWVQNDNGILTAYALGAAPTTALSVQYTKTEIVN